MKVTDSIQPAFFIDETHAGVRSNGRFDIHDAEGQAPEIICRVMLGLCLGCALLQCLVQLAAF